MPKETNKILFKLEVRDNNIKKSVELDITDAFHRWKFLTLFRQINYQAQAIIGSYCDEIAKTNVKNK